MRFRINVLAALLTLTTAAAHAQTTARRPVRRGDVTGVELQIEGSLSSYRGDKVRWNFTAYEVVGLDGLRPAPRARVQVATSLTPGAFAAEVTTDDRGRAMVEFDVPLDAPAAFGANIRVHAPRGVSRRFDVQVRTLEPRRITLEQMGGVRAGGRLPVVGRYFRFTGEPLGDQALTLVASDGRGPLGAPVEVRSDAQGVFVHEVRVPSDATAPIRVEVRGPRDEEQRQVSATTAVPLLAPAEPPLVVSATVANAVVTPGARVPVQVVVRRADGRPVEGARVSLEQRAIPLTEDEEEERDRYVRTDARGRATLEYRAPGFRRGYRDVQLPVQAGRAGIGRGRGQTRFRVSAEPHHVALSVEGGALVPTIEGRVYAEVLLADGRRAPGVPVRFEGPRIGSHEVRTDASGIAPFTLRLGAVVEDDRCGGRSATAVDVRVAGGNVSQLCLPIDPDAAAAVRAWPALAAPGDEVRITVQRARAAERLPVSVVAFLRDDRGMTPIATRVLDPREDGFDLAVPEALRGDVFVRARPLVGRAQQEARGGFSAFRIVSRTALESTLRIAREDRGLTLAHGVTSGVPATTIAVAFPLSDHNPSHASTLDDGRGGRLTPTIVATQLSRGTPLDVAAPIRLRGTEESPAPEPTNPEALGLLRDPWRASARFVEGRLALVFRAVEARVDGAVPDQIHEVAVQNGTRWRFNRQLLASLGNLGSEGATGLGGEPLTIERLESLDRNFDYDHVAERITRRRLFKMLLALRQFVQSRALDLAWVRPGDPTLWLEQLRNQHAPGMGSLRPGELVDGWGRPFELRPTARPRFGQLQPVAGYELVSAGPDGRYGNGDDVVDPTARVLPTGSLYARAVGEDALVARLQGVELGRATLAMASSYFGARAVGIPSPDGSVRGARLGDLPPVLKLDEWALALRRPSHPADSVIARLAGDNTLLELDAEPRTWRVVALSYTRDGMVSAAEGHSRAGASVISDLTLPDRVRVDEPLQVALHVTDVSDEGASFVLQAEGEGVDVQVPAEANLPAGETRTLAVTLRGVTPGRGAVSLRLQQGDRLLRSVRESIAVDRGLHPIRRRAGLLVRDRNARIDLEVPSGAQARLVAVHPKMLTADPDFGDLWRDDPALVAWAESLSGRRMDEALRARLLRAQTPGGTVAGRETALSTAAAIVALSGLFDERGRPDADAQNARARAVGALGNLPSFADRDGSAATLRMQASVVAALATSGLSDFDATPVRDPVARRLRDWLPNLRRALRDTPGEPSLLARSAAALLLVDPRDGHARVMLERVRESLEEAPGGLRVVPAEGRRGAQESLHATLAAAIAAHQVGDRETSQALLGYASRFTHDLARNGGEGAFWWFAASAYGAFGAELPESIRVRVNGSEHNLAVNNNVVSLPLTSGRQAIRVSGGQGLVLIKAEAVFGRSFTERSDAPLQLAIEGSVGQLGSLAALELSVTAQEAIGSPVLDIQLPAGVSGDDALIAQLERASSVRRAESRRPGFVRVWLGPLADEASATVPLPLRWRAQGTVRGLGVVAYAADRPDRMTVLAPRPLQIEPAE